MPDPNDINTMAFFTIRELAERWRCSDKSVRRKIARGDLAAHKIGANWLIATQDVRAAEAVSRRPARL